MAAGEVDDREPAKTETKRPRDVIALIVRTAMGNGPGHRLDVPTPNRRQVSEIILSANAAHEGSLLRDDRSHRFEPVAGNFVLLRFQVSGEQEAQATEQLRLSPTMHRHIVPTDHQLASSKRAIGFSPTRQQILKNAR